MNKVLAIDPGPVESAYALIDSASCGPLKFGKVPNDDLLAMLWDRDPNGLHTYTNAIEMVASYGMAVGAEVFETCVWIGRFQEALEARGRGPVALTKRMVVKLHHCHVSNATDSNITQALKDRFAPGERNHGKGTKDAPGWFYGFHKDVWQAYALAVVHADNLEGRVAA